MTKLQTLKKELKDINHQLKLSKEIDAYINNFENKKVAIWGAGHQALSTLALYNLADKISYIVDSADFKQGKYSSVTHIPIVSSNELISNPVEAIIIMAGSYSDEIAKIVCEDFNIANISILKGSSLHVYE